MNKKVIAITGASGFLGKKIVRSLIKSYNLIIFSTQKFKNTHQIIYKKYSLDENYHKIFNSKKIEGVIHIATNYGRKNIEKKEVYLANYKIPNKIFNAFTKSDIKFFINTDTFYTIKNHSHLKNYIMSKKKFFFKINKFNYKEKRIINLKLFHLVGRNDNKDKFIPVTIRALKSNKLIKLNSPKNYIDFIHINDVVDLYLRIIKNIKHFKKGNRNIDVGTGKTYSVLKLVKSLKKSLKSDSKIIYLNQLNFKVFVAKKIKNIQKLWKPKYSFKKIIKDLSY